MSQLTSVVIPPIPVSLPDTETDTDPAPSLEWKNADFSAQCSQLVAAIEEQMAADRKTTALKQLQGHMWRVGYVNGELRSVVYEDAVKEIQRWSRDCGLRVCIYSSGSIEAQKLLFGYTEAGSLLPYLSGHFDTTIGMKQESGSYERIVSDLKVEPGRVLFLTDILGEAQAAIRAGLQSHIVVRPGNAPVSDDCGIRKIHTFHEITV